MGNSIQLRADAASALQQAIDCLRGGGVVVFPTETVYCVAARADSPEAVGRLRAIQQRGTPRPGTLVPHLPSPAQCAVFVPELNRYQQSFLAKLWPGPVSVVIDASAPQKSRVSASLRIDESVLYHGNAITLRCPGHAGMRQVLELCGGMVIAAAAPDAHGQPTARYDDLAEDLPDRVDLMLDEGATKYGRPSTLVELRENGYNILRAGALEPRLIGRLLKTTLLFVCSGNTCRSPMAAAIAKALLAQRLGMREDDLEKRGFEIVSAGVGAMPGLPASEHAVTVAREFGGDLSHHRSQPLSESLLRRADLILTMTANHAALVQALDPLAKDKTLTLSPEGDIVDPIGGDLVAYRELASQMRPLIEKRLSQRKII